MQFPVDQNSPFACLYPPLKMTFHEMSGERRSGVCEVTLRRRRGDAAVLERTL